MFRHAAKLFWAIIGIAHLIFLLRLVQRLGLELPAAADAARLAGLTATIGLAWCEATGRSVLAGLHLKGDWRRALAFWTIIALLHAAVPYRWAEHHGATPTGSEAAVVLVLPAALVALALSLENLNRRRRTAGAASPDSPASLWHPIYAVLLAFTWPFNRRWRRDVQLRTALAPPVCA